jgi:hypothetical protein
MLREAYNAVGGHATVAGEILEDVALARLVKQCGYGIYFAAPVCVVRTRMYRSFSAMWQGWTKNLYPLMGQDRKSLFFELVETLPLTEAGIFAIAMLYFASVRTANLAPVLGLLAGVLLGRYLAYGAALYRNLYPTSYIQFYSMGSAWFSVALIASWWKSTRGRVVWKGREYSAKTP